jgi:hypothetical protein
MSAMAMLRQLSCWMTPLNPRTPARAVGGFQIPAPRNTGDGKYLWFVGAPVLKFRPNTRTLRNVDGA